MIRKLTSCAIVLAVLWSAVGCFRTARTIKAKYIQDNDYRQFGKLLEIKKMPPELDLEGRNQLDRIIWAYATDRADSAAAWIDLALNDSPADWRIHYLSGLLQSSLGQFDRAGNIYQACLNFAPDTEQARALIYVAMGENLEQQQQYGPARQHFLTALNLDPGSTDAQSGLDRLMATTSGEQ